MDVTKVVTTLLMFAVVFGILTQVLTKPNAANAVLAAGAGTVTGVVGALEGKG
jgi:hypothetical protein